MTFSYLIYKTTFKCYNLYLLRDLLNITSDERFIFCSGLTLDKNQRSLIIYFGQK